MTSAIDHTQWSFDAATRILTVGAVPCWGCKHGLPGRKSISPWVACGACKGTGKRGNGKCSKCKYYRDSFAHRNGPPGYQPGMVPDHGNQYDGGVCESCEGSTLQPGDGNAWLDSDMIDLILAGVPIKATVVGNELSWAESHIGILQEENDTLAVSNLYTVVDYGTRFRQLQSVAAADGDVMAALNAIRDEESADLKRHFSNVCGMGRKIESDRYRIFDEIHYQITPNGMRVIMVTDKTR